MTTHHPHDEAVVKMLKTDPAFADDYLSAALDEVGEQGGQAALLAALRHIAEAQGFGTSPGCDTPSARTHLSPGLAP